MNIRLANKSDLEQLNVLFKEVIIDMKKKKINMWNDVYPFCEFEYDISKKRMYVIEHNDEIIGSFVLCDADDSDYNLINWKYNEKWISLSRFAIIPEQQGNGYAKEAIKYIEKEVIKQNYKVIRLTVYEKNKYAIGLYEKLGFDRVESGEYCINDKKFIGYEKII